LTVRPADRLASRQLLSWRDRTSIIAIRPLDVSVKGRTSTETAICRRVQPGSALAPVTVVVAVVGVGAEVSLSEERNASTPATKSSAPIPPPTTQFNRVRLIPEESLLLPPPFHKALLRQVVSLVQPV
jgi:hypothetical protein